MANRILPLLYLNLGGEMMYILEQRLVAQNLGDKSSKGMQTFFNQLLQYSIIKVSYDMINHVSISFSSSE